MNFRAALKRISSRSDDWIAVSEKEELETIPDPGKKYQRYDFELVEVVNNES